MDGKIRLSLFSWLAFSKNARLGKEEVNHDAY
jgi:hypothetical protein